MNTVTPSKIKSINEYSVCTAIFAGTLVALTSSLLLDLLGVAIGLSLFSPSKAILYSLGIGTVIWALFSTIGSMYAGGWVAGYFSPARGAKRGSGILYGLMVSSISIFVFLALTISSVETIINTSFNGLRYAISMVNATAKESGPAINTVLKGISNVSPELTKQAKKAMPDLKPVADKIQQKAFELLPSNDGSAEKIKADLEKFIRDYLDSMESANHEEMRDKLVASLTEATGKSSEEINQKIDEWHNIYTEAKEQARQTVVNVSESAAKKIAQFALLNFLILISGIIAATIGGTKGISIRKKYNAESKEYKEEASYV